MDFFERQDKARRNTKLLVVYFVMAAVWLLPGCATSQQRTEEELTPERGRFLYPRQHLESLDPLERAQAERQAIERENEGSKKP